jgi:AcrR family transcriptional regulator
VPLSSLSPAAERAKIMEAAHRVLTANEGAAISIADVLSAAQLSTRAFYRHFDSKDGLLLAMFRQDADRVLAELQTASASAPSAAEALRAWITGMLRLTADPRRRRRALVLDSAEVIRAKGYHAERARYETAEVAALAQILHRGHGDGSFPLARPATDAAYVRAALQQAVGEQLSQTAAVGAEESAERVVGFALRALGAPDAT